MEKKDTRYQDQERSPDKRFLDGENFGDWEGLKMTVAKKKLLFVTKQHFYSYFKTLKYHIIISFNLLPTASMRSWIGIKQMLKVITIPIGGVKKKEFINFVQQMWTTIADQLHSSGEKFSLYHKCVCVCVHVSGPIAHTACLSSISQIQCVSEQIGNANFTLHRSVSYLSLTLIPPLSSCVNE